MKNTYSIDGRDFHSLKDLAAYVGKNEKTITARLRRGMSVEAACKVEDLRCTYHPYKDEKKPLSQICKDEGKNRELVQNRLSYGYSLEDALYKPKKISRQGKPIVVNGVMYRSISMACRELGLESRENTIRSRIRIGKSVDDAFRF